MYDLCGAQNYRRLEEKRKLHHVKNPDQAAEIYKYYAFLEAISAG